MNDALAFGCDSFKKSFVLVRYHEKHLSFYKAIRPRVLPVALTVSICVTINGVPLSAAKRNFRNNTTRC